MRVIDFGQVSALHSQTVWHALAHAARAGDQPVLSFARPRDPYACLGFHRDVAEVDLEHCAAEGLPVYRRMVGGGPVYLDSDQVFFQVVVPVRSLPARRSTALEQLLLPAVAALREVGVQADLDRYGEISVGQAKVCGHGAGQLGEGVAVVGNLITSFDHARATRILRLSADARACVLRLMRRHVHATPVDLSAWKSAMVRSYSTHFGSAPMPDRMTADEGRQLERMDALLGGPAFVEGDTRPPRPVRTVKVRAGVWVHEWVEGAERLVVGVADGVVESAVGGCRGIDPARLVGRTLDKVRSELDRDRGTAPLAAAIGAANTEVTAA